MKLVKSKKIKKTKVSRKTKAKPRKRVKAKPRKRVKTKPHKKTKVKPRKKTNTKSGRKRRKKVTRPAFEKRPRKSASYGPPPGFDLDVVAVASDEATATIRARLEDARARLPDGYEGKVLVHSYSDGSVDGELYVRIPPEVTDLRAEFDLYHSFTSISVGRRYWISSGARYSVITDDERYRRNRGLAQVQTNYQRATPSNIVEEHLILRRKIMGGMDKKFGVEAHSIFIRVHWNAENAQPQR